MLSILMSCVMSSVGGSPSTWIEDEFVPGTRVRLQPPVGWERAAEFAGFERERSQLRVQEYRRPYAKVLLLHEDEILARRGIRVLERETREVGGLPATMLSIEEPEAVGGRLSGWMLIVGDERGAARIWARVPPTQIPSGHARASLLTTEWDPERKTDPLQTLGLRLDLPSLEVARVGRRSATLTADGELPDPKGLEPVLEIERRAPSGGEETPAELALATLLAHPRFAEAAVEGQTEVAGLELPHSLLRARLKLDERPFQVHVLIVREKEHELCFVALHPSEPRWDTEFEAAWNSLRIGADEVEDEDGLGELEAGSRR